MGSATTDKNADAISERISDVAVQAQSITEMIASEEGKLTGISGDFPGHVAEVNGFTPTGAWETLHQDRLAKQIAEYTPLLTALQEARATIEAAL